MTRFKKAPEWISIFVLLLGFHQIHSFVLPIQISCLRRDYCVWNRLEALKMRLLPLAKNGRNVNLFGLFYFHNPIKWDNICHYECKFKIDIKRRFVYSAEKKTKFNFKSKRFSLYASTLIVSIYTPSSCA